MANTLSELVGAGMEQRDAQTLGGIDQGRAELIVWLPESQVQSCVDAVSRLLESLAEMSIDVAPWSWDTAPCDPDEWVDAYKQHFRTARIGRRMIVKPSWEDPPDLAADDLIIELDPGQAFGTGLHASSRLALKILERLKGQGENPSSVLDLGCGTAILAMFAVKLWPTAKALAVDNDPIAVEVARENIERNALSARVTTEERGAHQLEGKRDLVVANLNRNLLLELTEQLHGALLRGGLLVLSGLLSDQAVEVSQAYASSLRFEPLYSEDEDGWRGLLLRAR